MKRFHLHVSAEDLAKSRGMQAQLTAADARSIQEDEQACRYARSDIRRGHGTDLPAVVALLKGFGLPTDDLASTSGLQLWVLEAEQSLSGVIGMQRFGAIALLRSLAVEPSLQKRGLGRQLVARLEVDARADGIEHLVLLTETAETFFRAAGYEVTDRRFVPEEIKQTAEFRSLCPASAICMTKSLARP